MSELGEALRLLELNKNVLLTGPPGTGKSRLLSEVANVFVGSSSTVPTYTPTGTVPIQSGAGAVLPGALASVSNRKVFRCVFHQASKHREFVTGMIPDVSKGALPGAFRVAEGTLYKASEYALKPDSAALLIIDEMNRGPAVQLFGGSIVGIEANKRLDDAGQQATFTQYFEIMDPTSGDLIEYALPPRLYILAAMNQADVSVEPLDVAFLRRWSPLQLEPSLTTLKSYFGVGGVNPGQLPTTPSSHGDVYEACLLAFERLNERISLGRGPEFCIGHGLLMARATAPQDLNGALDLVSDAWRLMKNHIDEAFFGDARGAAAALNADFGLPQNPYGLEETSFAGVPKPHISGPKVIDSARIYDLFLSLSQAHP